MLRQLSIFSIARSRPTQQSAAGADKTTARPSHQGLLQNIEQPGTSGTPARRRRLCQWRRSPLLRRRRAEAMPSSSAEKTGAVYEPKDYTAGLPLKARLKKLFTKEDPQNLHKTLGLLSLVHYVYRYFWVFPREGSLGLADGPRAPDCLGVLLHVALSTSSLIFTVIRTRLLDKPTIIWEEYRLHAIVFSVRGGSVFLFSQLWPAELSNPDDDDGTAPRYGTDAQIFALYLFVLAHHVLADKITDWYGTPGESTVRGDGKRAGPRFKRLMRLYSLYQFLALGSHLTVHPLGADIGWNPMIAVQSSAFCMTLYRKRLIRGAHHAAIYTACLLLSAVHIVYMLDGYQNFMLKVAIVYLLRVRFGFSKYLLWALYSASFMPTVQHHVATFADDFVGGTTGLDLLTRTGIESTINLSIAKVDAYFDISSSTAMTELGGTDLLVHNSLACRCITACAYVYAVLVMRKEERNYPKDVLEMKARDEKRKQERLQRRNLLGKPTGESLSNDDEGRDDEPAEQTKKDM
jgi:hypothetical protein